MQLTDRVALITGAGSGIGRAMALLFAEAGATVVVADCDSRQGKAAVDRIGGRGGEALFVAADVSKSEDARRMVEAAVDAYGRLDILINNAGISIVGGVEELSEEDWDRVLGVNLKGVFLASKYAIPHLRRRGGGSIINVASVNALRPLAGRDAYSASKGALVALTRGMALGLAGDQIRVNCICPGTIDTPLLGNVASQLPPGQRPSREDFQRRQPLGRMGTPEEVAQAALYLASDQAAFITGSIFVIDGGMSL